jgi:hypothetical protein
MPLANFTVETHGNSIVVFFFTANGLHVSDPADLSHVGRDMFG